MVAEDGRFVFVRTLIAWDVVPERFCKCLVLGAVFFSAREACVPTHHHCVEEPTHARAIRLARRVRMHRTVCACMHARTYVRTHAVLQCAYWFQPSCMCDHITTPAHWRTGTDVATFFMVSRCYRTNDTCTFVLTYVTLTASIGNVRQCSHCVLQRHTHVHCHHDTMICRGGPRLVVGTGTGRMRVNSLARKYVRMYMFMMVARYVRTCTVKRHWAPIPVH